MARGVYKIINIINNKFYIGSAVDFKRRKARHFSELRNKKHNNKHLQQAWDKYGENAFIFVILEEANETDDLLYLENKWLKEHVGQQYCYNIGVDATAPMLGMSGELSPTWGYKHTEESKLKISKAGKDRPQSKETRAKRIKTMRNHYVSKETREKISNTLSGEGNFWYGKKRPEHGVKVSKVVIVTKPNGEEVIYESISKLREDLDVTPTTVHRALNSGKGFNTKCCGRCGVRYK